MDTIKGNAGSVNQYDPICEACSKIDFRRVLELNSTTLSTWGRDDSLLVAELDGSVILEMSDSCALCRLWLAILKGYPIFKPGEHATFELRAFSLLDNYYKIQTSPYPGLPGPPSPEGLKTRDQPCLAIVSNRSKLGIDEISLRIERRSWPFTIQRQWEATGFLFGNSENTGSSNIFSPQILLPAADICFIQKCLHYCISWHQGHCRANQPQAPSLNVIDCNTATVIEAPSSCLYAALSYVWSQAARDVKATEKPDNCTDTQELHNAPRTIRDAIVLTKTLGLQYLWVDKYCIDQVTAISKLRQIQNMDLVYKGAQFTIVATAGKDDTYGLPGINATPRQAQNRVHLRGLTILSTMKEPHDSIRSSVWSTRAWTYQEAVLSHRRIVFTDNQVYFECNAMNCCEGLQPDLDALHTPDRTEFLPIVHRGILAGQDPSGTRHHFGVRYARTLLKSFERLVYQYSLRSLTFESDSLNAFLGIAKHINVLNSAVVHIWGVPFLSLSEYSNLEHTRADLSEHLLWYHSKTEKLPLRRTVCPSWTWAGWEAPVDFPMMFGNFACKVSDIHLELDSGELLEHEQFMRMLDPSTADLCLPRGLQLDVVVASSTLLSMTISSEFQSMYDWSFSTSHTFGMDRVGPHVSEQIVKGEWLLLLIGIDQIYDRVPQASYYFLVVRQENGFVSRIGYAEFCVNRVMPKVKGFDEAVAEVSAQLLPPTRIRLL